MAEAAMEERKRTVKLFCPSVPKIVQIIEPEDKRLDLGFIARAFGLDPNTLKLNGHFISRGVDFIASSVTWKSLIGFFSARGLSTGGTHSDALLVHGKLSTNAPKRKHDLEDAESGILATNQQGYVRNSKRQQLEYTKMVKNDSREIKSVDLSIQTAWCNGPNAFGLKRRLWLEDDSRLKKSKTYEAFPGLLHILRFPYFPSILLAGAIFYKSARRADRLIGFF
ncbi:uncharacterized protein [Henckelia pumila]|uniref:uncharacterized protein isoform X2 n=1 Tax=Henckelia pumila TaxID=405737 RepID=UPI003C6DC956